MEKSTANKKRQRCLTVHTSRFGTRGDWNGQLPVCVNILSPVTTRVPRIDYEVGRPDEKLGKHCLISIICVVYTFSISNSVSQQRVQQRD